jgi:hypothetical protein
VCLIRFVSTEGFTPGLWDFCGTANPKAATARNQGRRQALYASAICATFLIPIKLAQMVSLIQVLVLATATLPNLKQIGAKQVRTRVAVFTPSVNPPFDQLEKSVPVFLAFSIPRINALRGYVIENTSRLIFPSWTSPVRNRSPAPCFQTLTDKPSCLLYLRSLFSR